LLLAIVFLCIAGYWSFHAVREGLEDIIQGGLESLVKANVRSVELWLRNEKEDVKSWAGEPHLRSQVTALVQGRNTALSSTSPNEEINRTLQTIENEADNFGFAVFVPSGGILASSKNEMNGRKLSPLGLELLSAVFSGETLINRPFRRKSLLEGEASGDEQPVLIAAAPIRDNQGKIVAGLLMQIDPDKDFSQILAGGNVGNTGKSFAFDKEGAVLSATRFDVELKKLGLLPDSPQTSAILNLYAREPDGGLTRMVASASSSGGGVDIEGYRDFRGVKVIGAWEWLEKYGFGIGVEVEKKEVWRVLRPIILAFGGLLFILAAATFAIFISTSLIGRLRERIHVINRLGQYTLVEKIGEGGMGKVFKARHALLRRPTAIKVIRDDRASEEELARFEREVQITSQLTHPNTVEIYDYGRSPEGVFYYAMEYLPGIDLGQLVNIEGQVAVERVIHILRQVCASLNEAHQRKLVHRDIKPPNVMLCTRGGVCDTVKVLDFGLTKEATELEELEKGSSRGILGTPGYIAPERLQAGKEVGILSDIYSVGAVGFFLLTGELVFPADTPMETAWQTVNSQPTRPSERLVRPLPGKLDDLILRCLSPDPAGRPQSSLGIISTLESLDEAASWNQEKARTWWHDQAENIRRQIRLSRPKTAEDSFDTTFDISLTDR
jgi:tRNA A-37 threonylcarbamoyl transferase component Bud32